MSEKMTKQGVRDLDAKFGRRKPKRRDEPPREAFVCKHKDELGRATISTDHIAGDTYCDQCGETWDWYGKRYDS